MIHPVGIRGQIEGGIAQGVGLAVMEELIVEHGSIANGNFTDYLVPTIADMPPVEAALVGSHVCGPPMAHAAPVNLRQSVRRPRFSQQSATRPDTTSLEPQDTPAT